MDSNTSRINIAALLGDDIRSRSCMNAINARIERARQAGARDVTLDFAGVRHISRSFADELCETIDRLHVTTAGMAGEVKNMHDIVADSRKGKRVRPEGDASVQTIKDMESLSRFLATI